MIDTLAKLKEWAHSPQPEPEQRDITVQFGIPEGSKASLYVLKQDIEIGCITCLTWEETLLVRKLTRFGSNHDQKPAKWSTISEYFFFLAVAAEAQREEARQ